MFKFEFEGEKDLDSIIQVFSGAKSAVSILNKADIMTPGVRAIGAGLYDNFVHGGSRVGGWAPLSPHTILERELRGYSTRYLLYQSGSLQKNAIDPFRDWGEQQKSLSINVAPTPINEGVHFDFGDESVSGGAIGVATLTPRTFKATLSGPKAMNQTGGRISIGDGQWSQLPARPFWFIDQRMLEDAEKKILAKYAYYQFRGLPQVSGLDATSWNRFR